MCFQKIETTNEGLVRCKSCYFDSSFGCNRGLYSQKGFDEFACGIENNTFKQFIFIKERNDESCNDVAQQRL